MKKKEILKGFSKMIAEYGLENISIAKLAKHLQIPSSLVIYYFQNRDTLVREMISYVLDRCLEFSYPGIDKTIGDPAQQLQNYLDTLFGPLPPAEEFEAEARVFFTCRNLALRDEEARRLFQDYQKQILSMIEEDLQYFQQQGLVGEIDTGEAAALLYSLLNGLDDFSDFLTERETFQSVAESSKKLYKTYLKVND